MSRSAENKNTKASTAPRAGFTAKGGAKAMNI